MLSIKSIGPYLARFDESRQQVEILVPKPADALYFEAKSEDKQKSATELQVRLIRLAPKPLEADCGTDLPEGLLPVQMSESIKGKPKAGVAYWTLEHLKKWQAGEASNLDFTALQQAGLNKLPIEIRTHVAIDSITKATQTGKLFQTANLDFGYAKTVEGQGSDGQVWQDKRLGFIVQTEHSLSDDMVTFGGERRLSKFTPIASIETLYDNDLEPLLNQINTAKGFRLTFLTPCIFANGYLPAWLETGSKQGKLPNTDANVRLRACAIDRWEPVSGWDSILWQPKAMRKAVSSGSVYWFSLENELSLAELMQLTQLVWSDDKQDKRDGFGSAILAPWLAV